VRFYGKLRSHPEYLGRLSGDDTDVSFEDWLDRSVGFAYHEGKSPWRAAYDAGCLYSFVYRTKATSTPALAGALAPSQDSVSRAFPIVTVTTVSAEGDEAMACVPVAGEAFFTRCAAVLGDARASGVVDHVTHALPELPLVEPSAIEGTAADFAEWSARPGVLAKAWKSLFPRGRANEAARVIAALIETVERLRTSDARRYVRLPLGGGGAAAAALWLHVLARAVPARIAVAAWSESRDPTLFVALGHEPPVDFLLRLWSADLRSVDTLDARAPSDGWPEVGLSASLSQVLASRDASVRDLLSAIGSAPPTTDVAPTSSR
jgi:type VI secretion system protein ImpM